MSQKGFAGAIRPLPGKTCRFGEYVTGTPGARPWAPHFGTLTGCCAPCGRKARKRCDSHARESQRVTKYLFLCDNLDHDGNWALKPSQPPYFFLFGECCLARRPNPFLKEVHRPERKPAGEHRQRRDSCCRHSCSRGSFCPRFPAPYGGSHRDSPPVGTGSTHGIQFSRPAGPHSG